MVDTDKSVSMSKKRSFFQRRSVRVLIFLVLVIIVTLVALPFGIRIYLEKWLEENGADSATIAKVRFVPFTGVVGLDGVEIIKDGQTVFSDSTIYVNLGLKNLLSHEALFQQVTLENITLDIARNENGSFRIASYTIPVSGKKSEEKDVEVEEVTEKSLWTLLANAVDVKNVKIRYQQPDLKVELVIEEAFIEKFNTDPDIDDGSLRLKGTVNGAEVEIDLPKLYVDPFVDLSGRIAVNDFKLSGLADMLGPVLKPFDGSANLDAKVQFTLKDTEDIDVNFDGSLSLNDGDIGGEAWSTKGTVGYEGVASFSKKEKDMHVLVDGDLRAERASFDMPQPLIDIDNPNILISGKTVVDIADGVLIDTGASLTLAPTSYVAENFKTGAGDTSWQGKVLVDTGTDSRDLSVKVNGKMSMGAPFFDLAMEKGLLEIGNDLISWDGNVEYVLHKGDTKGSSVSTDGILMGKQTYCRIPEVVDISQQGLELKGKTEAAIGDTVDVGYKGAFHLEGTGVEVAGMSIAEEKLTWQGDVGYTQKEKGKNQLISLNGAMDFVGTDFGMSTIDLQINQDSIHLLPEFELTLADKPFFSGRAGIEAKGLAIKKKSVPLLTLGRVSVAGLQGDGSGGIVVESLESEALKVPSSETVPVSVNIPSLALGKIHSPDLMSGSAESFVAGKPTVKDKNDEVVLAGLSAIKAENIEVSKDITATVGRVVLDGGQFMIEQAGKPMATLGQLVAEKLEYSTDNGLVCDAISADTLYADILREKSEPGEKEVNKKEEQSDEEKKEEKVAAIPVRINRFDVTGKSVVKFSDTSLARTFMTLFNIDSLAVRDIDLNKPEQPFSYQLKGRIDKYTPLEIDGTCAPLARKLIVSQKATLRNYSMLHVSPYVVEAIGVFFPSGMLDLHSTLEIAEGNIDMKNNLLIKELVTEGVQGDLKSELDNQLPVPLNLAISMLKDSDGVIDLDVPVKGKLSDISIGTADLIWTPISKAITVAVTPYLAYTALGPAGALYYVGAKVGGGLLKTTLPVLEFEKGQRDLTEKNMKKIKKAGKIIVKNLDKIGDTDPEYAYSICAKVSMTELTSMSNNKDENQEVLRNEEIRKELFKLGEARSLAVKKYLVENFNIDESRLMICNPGLNFDKEAAPVIEFMK